MSREVMSREVLLYGLSITTKIKKIAPLVNKPYVNEVTWNEQNLYQKSCQTSELNCVYSKTSRDMTSRDMNLAGTRF